MAAHKELAKQHRAAMQNASQPGEMSATVRARIKLSILLVSGARIGPGKAALLESIRDTGSISAAPSHGNAGVADMADIVALVDAREPPDAGEPPPKKRGPHKPRQPKAAA